MLSFWASLFLYMLLSASIMIACISWAIISFVEAPSDKLSGIFCLVVFLHSFFILATISSESAVEVFGKGSQTHLRPSGPGYHQSGILFFNISAVFTSRLSPSLWPNTSFISFSPFRSPIIKLSGSCLWYLGGLALLQKTCGCIVLLGGHESLGEGFETLLFCGR